MTVNSFPQQGPEGRLHSPLHHRGPPPVLLTSKCSKLSTMPRTEHVSHKQAHQNLCKYMVTSPAPGPTHIPLPCHIQTQTHTHNHPPSPTTCTSSPCPSTHIPGLVQIPTWTLYPDPTQSSRSLLSTEHPLHPRPALSPSGWEETS